MLCRYLLLLAIALTGCAGRATTPTLDPASLADEIDPPHSSPLVADLPLVVREGLCPASERAALLRSLRETFGQWNGEPREGNQERDATWLVRAVLVMELESASSCDLACLRILERLYMSLALVNQAGFAGFLRHIRSWLDALPPEGRLRSTASLLESFEQIATGAGTRHRWAAARILRDNSEPRAPAQAFHGLAAVARAGEDHELASTYLQRAIELLGEEAGPSLHRQLAAESYRALDLPGGDAAVARLRDLDNVEPELFEALAATRQVAQRYREVGADTGLEAGLRRVELLLDLDRSHDAERLCHELARAHLQDGRPVVALVVVLLDRSWFRLVTAGGSEMAETLGNHLARARRLGNLGQRGYELSAIVLHSRLMHHVAAAARAGTDPPITEAARESFTVELEEVATGLERFDAGLAAAFRIFLDAQISVLSVSGREATREPLNQLLRRALDGVAQHPDDRRLLRVAFALAASARERELAERVAQLPMPAGDDDDDQLAVMHQWVRYYHAARFGDAALLPASEIGDAELQALRSALVATDDADWAAVAGQLGSLAADAAPAERPRYLANRAVALFRARRPEPARQLLSQLLTEGHELPSVVRLNALLMRPDAGRGAAWLRGLGELQGDRHQAVGLRATQQLHRAGEATEEQLQQAQGDFTGPFGVVLLRSVQVSFSYNRRTGTRWTSEPLGEAWLLVEE